MEGFMHSRAAAISVGLALLFVSAATPPASARSRPDDVASPMIAGINLERATIPDLQHAMDTGRLSSVELTAFYLRRIHTLNPVLHAVIATNQDALGLAAASDARRRRHDTEGPMDGIPVLLKANIDTGDSEPSTAGSFALADSRPGDAGLVRRLRAAGAVLLGKTNMSEWAGFRSVHVSSGWSAMGGQASNPYVLGLSPGGSSSGSGVAVSANLSTVAIGTETDGSVVCPSALNGVVGIKPSLGLVSRGGIVPITEQQDTAGPIARNVTDAAILLGVIDGPDRLDPITVVDAAHAQHDYTRYLKPNALRGMRIGVWRDMPDQPIAPATQAAFDTAVKQLQRLGATTVDITIPYLDVVDANEFPAIHVEFKHDINAYLAATPGRHPTDLAGLMQYNVDHAAVEMPFFTQNLFEEAQATNGDLSDPHYIPIRQAATGAAQRGLNETLSTYHLDAIVSPTENPAWQIPLGTGIGDGGNFLESSTPAAVSGYSDMTVPMGFVGSLPVGMSIMGGQFSEPTLLAVAYAFQQGTQARRPPEFLPAA
jgi:amidase